MINKALLCGLYVIIAVAFMSGCQSNTSITDNETQKRVARLEEKMGKLESALQEKDTVISNLNQQISTLKNQNDSLSAEFHQFKSSSENKFAINEIDVQKIMINLWIALGIPATDKQCLIERYGDLNRYTISRNPGQIERPILYNKLVNTEILKETTTFNQTK